MLKTNSLSTSRYAAQQGFTLVEVLIALALGMLITSAALGILIASRTTSGITRSLGQLQENERLAFSLLAADLRRAGDYPCAGFTKRVDNEGNDPLVYLSKTPHPNLNHHRDGIYGGTTNTMDSLALYMDNASGAAGYAQFAEVAGYQHEISNHKGTYGESRRASSRLSSSGLAVICNADVAMVYNLKTTENCSSTTSRKAPNYANCTAKDATRLKYCFWPSQLNHTPKVINHPDQFDVKFNNECDEIGRSTAFILETGRMQVDWYVADNGRGSRSLYRRYNFLRGSGGQYELRERAEEIVTDISALELRYHVRDQDDYKRANEIAADQWRNVDTVYVKITFQTDSTTQTKSKQIADVATTDSSALTREMKAYIAVRNHVPHVI